MPSLTAKQIKGRTYYYVRECQRVKGKPKITNTVYLGTLGNIVAAVQGAKELPEPQSVDIARFGDVAALFHIATEIQLVQVIDKHVPKRRQGLSVGQYMLLAAINRATSPTSKLKLAAWYAETSLRRLIPAGQKQLTSQSFWNHMNAITESHIEATERELSQLLVEKCQVSMRTLVYDGTNFFTYINTRNPGALAKRGHNKQKRNDLRQVNLGMLVSTDFHIPLFHKVYEGNVNDATNFKTITEELRQRYVELARECEHITLIFDKGNNSKEAFATLDESDFHFVGSLQASHHQDLLQVPLRKFENLAGERLSDSLAYRTKKVAFGVERTIVVTHNENLLEGQLQGISANLQKARKVLSDIQIKLRRRREGKTKGGRKPTVESVRKQVEKALCAEFMKRLVKYQVTDEKGIPSLTFRTDASALARIVRIELGKTILFTDNDDWSNEEIILGYRAQYKIENAFRQMKNPHFLGWSPMFHWTDSKIRVHAFYCVLALTLTSLLQRTLYHHGIDMSISAMLESLAGIRETLVIYPRKSGQRKHRCASCLSTLSPQQEALLDTLDLRQYLPR